MIWQPLETKYLEQAVPLYRMGWDLALYTMTTIYPEEAFAALTAIDARFWVLLDNGGEVMGLGGFEKIRPFDRTAEPYIALAPKHQKKGNGWTIAKNLWAEKDKLNLRRIQSIVLEHSPTREYLENLGFKQEGVLKAMRLRLGKPVNGLLYGWVRE